MVNHKVGKAIRGKNYREPCNKCAIPPWDACECSFPAALQQDEDEGQLALWQQAHMNEITA